MTINQAFQSAQPFEHILGRKEISIYKYSISSLLAVFNVDRAVIELLGRKFPEAKKEGKYSVEFYNFLKKHFPKHACWGESFRGEPLNFGDEEFPVLSTELGDERCAKKIDTLYQKQFKQKLRINKISA